MHAAVRGGPRPGPALPGGARPAPAGPPGVFGRGSQGLGAGPGRGLQRGSAGKGQWGSGQGAGAWREGASGARGGFGNGARTLRVALQPQHGEGAAVVADRWAMWGYVLGVRGMRWSVSHGSFPLSSSDVSDRGRCASKLAFPGKINRS